MDKIIYEEEDVLKKVFTGTYTLDGLRLSEEQQRKIIFDMARAQGIKIDNEDEYTIGYEGAEDNNGISETQSTKFVIYHKEKEIVPYKVVEEYVDSYHFTEQESTLSKEEKERIAIEKLGDLNDGVSEYRVNFDGADDENGLYDTPLEKYTVYRVASKERIEESKEEVVTDKEKLEKYLEDLKQLRDKLDSIEDIDKRNKIIEDLLSKEDIIGKDIKDINFKEESSLYKSQIKEIKNSIKELEGQINESIKAYKGLEQLLADIIEEENRIRNNDELMENEEIRALLEEFGQRKYEINEESIKIKAQLDQQKKSLSAVKKNKAEIEKDYKQAEILEYTYDVDYALKKKSIINKIFIAKGISEDIINKKVSERTEEEKALIAEAKKEIEEELNAYTDESKGISVLDAIQALYALEFEYQLSGKVKLLKINSDELDNIRINASKLTERVVGNTSKVNKLNPGKAPEDMVTEDDEFKYPAVYVGDLPKDFVPSDKKEVIKNIIYEDEEVLEEVFTGSYILDGLQLSEEAQREKVFNIMRAAGVTIENEDDYVIGYEGADDNKGESETQSTKFVVSRKVKKQVAYEVEEEYVDSDYFTEEESRLSKEEKERIAIERLGKLNDGVSEYRVNFDGADDGNGLYDNPLEKYTVYRVISKKPIEEPKEDTKEEVKEETEESYDYGNDVVERITVYKDEATGDKYLRVAAIRRFKVYSEEELKNLTGQRIYGSLCYKISEDEFNDIASVQNNETSPFKLVVVPVKLNNLTDTPKPKPQPEKTETPEPGPKPEPKPGKTEIPEPGPKPEPDPGKTETPEPKPQPKPEPENKQEPRKGRIHYQTIIEKLTKGLNIKDNDAKRYKASNIKVAKKFKNELNSGNYLYNIVHVALTPITFAASLVSKGVNKLLLGVRGKTVMENFKKRLDKLSDEELEVLFTEYKGSALKTNMNNSIDPLILDKLREYGLRKVEVLNSKIRDNYAILFTILGQIDGIDKEIAKTKDKDKLNKLKEHRKAMMAKAADCVNNIEADRLEADNLLSSGVHGLEEDFKAVSTKLSYVGMRFAKTHNFNHELQAKLAEYGQGLRDAQANSDNEAIVENFMGLESCYYDNTKISNSIFGKRSVGEKYFTPIAEQFDYRDDPFITDLLSTIVIATAAVSAVNSIRTAINNQKAVQAHNAELDKVNAQNNATMNDVHKVGDNITGQGDNYMEGMKAGINQDNLNIANASERGAMDATDWGFGDYYRSLDSANHEMYNGIYDSTTSQIDTISSQYVNGAISQVEALKQLAEVQTTTQSKLVEVINNYKDVCTEYAATHTQFDLHSLLGSFDYISSNPEAITKMAESGIYSIEEAAKLAGMSAAQATAFAGLDSDVLTTLIAAGSAASLVNRVTRTMSKNFNDGKYNSKFRSEHAREVDAMFEDYYGEEETNKKRK